MHILAWVTLEITLVTVKWHFTLEISPGMALLALLEKGSVT